nr:C-type lectin domain family 2 member D-like [Procambarus clarkii]
MRLTPATLYTCTLTLILVVDVALAQKNPSRPLEDNDVLSERIPNGGGKRYGSSARNDVRRYGVAPTELQVHDGHRMITRALWRIFDALMQKKDHSQLYGRMGFVEEALKKMISVDSQLEDEIDKLKVRFFLQWAAAAYSSCPQPFVKVDGECFYLAAHDLLGWEDARRDCGKLGGDLASPHSLPALRVYLASIPEPPEYLWVGASQRDDGSWVWSSGPQAGVPVDMSKDTWNEEVPSGSGKCMGLFAQSSFRAYNYDCQEKDLFVCQYYF